MSKTEIVRRLDDTAAQRQIARTIADLQRQIETLQPGRLVEELNQAMREAHSQHLDELAAQLEPLAQAMAALTDETRETLSRIQDETARSQQAAAEQWRTMTSETAAAGRALEHTAQKLTETVQDGRRAILRVSQRVVLSSALTGFLVALAGILGAGGWIWYSQQQQTAQQMALRQDLEFQNRITGELHRYLTKALYPNLNPQRQAEIADLYRRLGLRPPGQ
ncbi:MAG: IncQ-type mobilization protein MobB [Pseudomonadota bacterium]|nr:IncQ-type mobilization protein MobB [Pseudomonadota bacterium]